MLFILLRSIYDYFILFAGSQKIERQVSKERKGKNPKAIEMASKHYVLFDLDGTLIDTVDFILECFLRTFGGMFP